MPLRSEELALTRVKFATIRNQAENYRSSERSEQMNGKFPTVDEESRCLRLAVPTSNSWPALGEINEGATRLAI